MKIAVDFDDVISSTNQAVCNWHNRVYGTKWSIDDFHYYRYWKNPGWGNQQQTADKVQAFYSDKSGLNTTEMVQGAREALSQLKAHGHDLIIVTARSDDQREMTRQWLDANLHGLFDQLYFTGEFTKKETENDEEQVHVDEEGVPTKGDKTNLSKADIIDRIEASILIDDSIENAFACAGHSRKHGAHKGNPIPTLLFSPFPPTQTIPVWHYPWNVELSGSQPLDQLDYEERKRRGLSTGESRQPSKLPQAIKRVSGWNDVLHKIEDLEKRSRSSVASLEGGHVDHAQPVQVQA